MKLCSVLNATVPNALQSGKQVTQSESKGRSQRVSDSPSTILKDDIQCDDLERVYPNRHLVLKKSDDGVPE